MPAVLTGAIVLACRKSIRNCLVWFVCLFVVVVVVFFFEWRRSLKFPSKASDRLSDIPYMLNA